MKDIYKFNFKKAVYCLYDEFMENNVTNIYLKFKIFNLKDV